MYIQVKLLNGFKKRLTYAIPSSWPDADLTGKIVRVPLRKQIEVAVVEEMIATLDPQPHYEIRQALSIEPFPHDDLYTQYLDRLCFYYQIEPIAILKRIRDFLRYRRERKPQHASQEIGTGGDALLKLTAEQQSVADSLIQDIRKGIFFPAVLHGLTGSGKTEVYKELIAEVLEKRESVLFLVPEVSLAVVLEERLRRQFTSHVYGFHSATSQTVKRKLFSLLIAGEPVVIIGVHLPVLLPIANLGLIIIDEEHEVGFQEKKHPKINSKEAALLRAQLYGITIVLGSATPSVHSWYQVKHNPKSTPWHLYTLSERFTGRLPSIKRLCLTDYAGRKSFWISPPLEEAIRQRLIAREGIILFLNRRGYSFFIQCVSCAYIPECIHCSVSLTLHEDDTLRCHYCSQVKPNISTCPLCGQKKFLKKGIGTQQLVCILENLFPDARVARADLDSTVNRVKWQKTLDDFRVGIIDILVGTQTICKGYHFPKVTLVGVLWADINLSMPMYNAAEVTLQQLIQVAGRAGRAREHSEVIIQSMRDHQIFQYLDEKEYPNFLAHELENRRVFAYPPLGRFAQIELRHKTEKTVIQDADTVWHALNHSIVAQKLSVNILGPTVPLVEKIKNMYSRLIYFKSQQATQLIGLYRSLDVDAYKSDIFFTQNPLN